MKDILFFELSFVYGIVLAMAGVSYKEPVFYALIFIAFAAYHLGASDL